MMPHMAPLYGVRLQAERGKRSQAPPRRKTCCNLLIKMVREFLDDRISEDLAGDALDLCFGGLSIKRVGQGELKVFTLAHVLHRAELHLSKSPLNGLPLGIKH